jgi:hypothetical protein
MAESIIGKLYSKTLSTHCLPALKHVHAWVVSEKGGQEGTSIVAIRPGSSGYIAPTRVHVHAWVV